MQKLIMIVATVGSLFLGVRPAQAKDQDLKCPEHITAQTAVRDAPKGWQTWNADEDGKNAVHNLSSVAVYEGPPSKHVQMAPDNADSEENTWTWTFLPFGEKRSAPMWIVCHYASTSIAVARSLPTKIKSCKVEFKPGTDPDQKSFGAFKCI
jgi:hypothetical protein